jgi:hypothetical protein
VDAEDDLDLCVVPLSPANFLGEDPSLSTLYLMLAAPILVFISIVSARKAPTNKAETNANGINQHDRKDPGVLFEPRADELAGVWLPVPVVFSTRDTISLPSI